MSTSLRPAPTLWGDKRFHTWNYEMRDQFQEKVFKVMLDAGFTCPNRDGTIAKGGCTFCAPAAPVILPDDGGTILLPSSTPSVTGGPEVAERQIHRLFPSLYQHLCSGRGASGVL